MALGGGGALILLGLMHYKIGGANGTYPVLGLNLAYVILPECLEWWPPHALRVFQLMPSAMRPSADGLRDALRPRLISSHFRPRSKELYVWHRVKK